MIPNWEIIRILREKFEKHPNMPDPPPPGGKRKEPKSKSPPPPPPKKSSHPLPKPVYPGSPKDKRKQAAKKRRDEQDARTADQKEREKKGTHSTFGSRSPFGDSVVKPAVWI